MRAFISYYGTDRSVRMKFKQIIFSIMPLAARIRRDSCGP